MGRYDGEDYEDGCSPHPTTEVMSCSPDPVLTHDGKTSHACRRCVCGRIGHHEEGCNAGKGPKPKVPVEIECGHCGGSGWITVMREKGSEG